MAILTAHKNDILNALTDNKAQLQIYGVQRIGLFGSFIKGQQNDTSDIDLLVEFDVDQKTFDNFMALSFFLEELFGRKVELVTKESLSPYIGPHILNEIEYVTVST